MAKTIVSTARGKKGDGSIRYNQSAKQWEARLVYGKKRDGSPDRRTRYAATEKEIQKILREMRKERDSIIDLDSCEAREMTMSDYYAGWLKKKRLLIKDKSFDRLEQTVNLHVLPFCGMVVVKNMNATKIQDIIFALIEEQYSYSVIKKAYYALNNLFRDAMTRATSSAAP